MPRVRIGELMILIALVAANFLMIRLDRDGSRPVSRWWTIGTDQIDLRQAARLRSKPVSRWWTIGTLPMLNILAAGLLAYPRRPESRGFLLGFAIFGATAIGNYIGMVTIDHSYLRRFLEFGHYPIVEVLGPPAWSSTRGMLAYILLSSWTLLPQLAFALLGAYLMRGYGLSKCPELDAHSVKIS